MQQLTQSARADFPDADPIWPCWIRAFDHPLVENERGWNIYRVFRGSTAAMKQLSSHISVLSANVKPHAPHEHAEEELIVMLSGAAEIVRVAETPAQEATAVRVGPGSFAYHSAYQCHTIRCLGPGPASYLIFKWCGDLNDSEDPQLKSSVFHLQHVAGEPDASPSKGLARKRILDSHTLYLRRLRCHLTTLAPGAGYRPHRDAYDVAILVLSGTVETLGRRVVPHGVIFYAAGEPHGMKNVGTTPASYLVFEFHGGDYKPEFRPEAAKARRPWHRRLISRARKRAARILNALR